MPTFRGYIRVSTEEQGLSYSPATQRERLERAANQMSMPYVHYEDHATGKVFNRTDFNRLMKDLKPGDVIGVRDAKRLGRNLREGVEFIYEIMGLGVANLYVKNRLYNLKSIKDKHDLQTDLNDAEYDLEERRELSLEGIRKKQELGQWVFSTRLMGYELDKKGNVSKNEAEAELIKDMAAQYVGGRSFRQIALFLNSQKVPTKKEANWTPTTVRRILLNPIFSGHYVPRKWSGNTKTLDVGKIKIEDLIQSKYYEPIVEFETYKQILSSYRGVKRTHARQFGYRYRSYLLTGLIRCKNCENLGKNVRYVHSVHKQKNSEKVNSNYTSRLHLKGCKNRFKTLRESVFNFVIESLFVLVFLDSPKLGTFVEKELSGIKEQLLQSLETRSINLSELEKVNKKLAQLKKRIAELEAKMESETDEDKVESYKDMQEGLYLQGVKYRKQVKSLKSEPENVISLWDSNGQEYVFEVSKLEGEVKEDLVDSALEEAAEKLTRQFSETSLSDYIQAMEDGDRRNILIRFLEEISIRNEVLSVVFKNGQDFTLKLSPNKGRKIQRVFDAVSRYGKEVQATFIVDYEKRTIAVKEPKLDQDEFKNVWYYQVRDQLDDLKKRIRNYSTERPEIK